MVLCCWRIPSMQRSMIKYFTSNPASSEYTSSTWFVKLNKYYNRRTVRTWRQLCIWVFEPQSVFNILVCLFFPPPETRCLPMVLSSFSHYSVIHMVANMFVLWTFSSGIVSLLGKEQFLALYLSAGESNKKGLWSDNIFIKSKFRIQSVLNPEYWVHITWMNLLRLICCWVKIGKIFFLGLRKWNISILLWLFQAWFPPWLATCVKQPVGVSIPH